MIGGLIVILLAFAAEGSAQPLRPDADRDRVFHGTIQQFIDGTLTAEQLEKELRDYLRQFEERPYQLSAAPIQWVAIPQERVFAFAGVLAKITQPVLMAWAKNQLTTAEAAVKLAPSSLVWPGYGFDADAGTILRGDRTFDDLTREVGKYAAP